MHGSSLPEFSPTRRLHRRMAACVIVISGWLWPPMALTQDLAIPGPRALTDVEEIELVYAGSQPIPKIIVRGRQTANSFVLSSYRPIEPRLNLLAQAAVGHPTGVCRTTQIGAAPPLHLRVDQTESSPCATMWSLQAADKSLGAPGTRDDLKPYED
jgi:hypothetical protein